MGQSSQKIDRDKAKKKMELKDGILKNDSFSKEKHNFLTKTVIFQNLNFNIFSFISVNL